MPVPQGPLGAGNGWLAYVSVRSRGMLGRVTTRLYADHLTLPVAPLGGENPLPPLRRTQELHEIANLDGLPPEMQQGIRYGGLPSTLPCLMQDGYRRARTETEVPALVLENQRVRATVLPSYGGRLWSLEHDGRELLYRNPVVQPANLALRDAWLAGGVEWNLGSTGHWTGTCEPLHAATVDGPDGSPVLRLWEWERTRNLVLQLDFWLPPDSELLYVGVRIRNPHAYDVPAYWWSNIAVPQTPDTRVLAPADQAWHFGYGGRLDLVDVPEHDGIDLTYPMRHRRAADYFFELPDGQRPWITALDAAGTGLVQMSTARLRGRKLFVWGEGAGGHRWQEWLAPGADGHGYTEIQAGLARTQLEHLRLPAATTWHWLEAYGALSVPPDAVRSPWPEARVAAGEAVEVLLPSADLATRYDEWLAVADREPGERLATGSGWGALELARTAAALPGTPFDVDTLTDRQRPWLGLLDGSLPATDPAVAPDGTLVAPGWRDLLESAPDNWLVWYHRGVARWYDGDAAGATEAWQRSLADTETPWALRNLAITAASPSEAADLYRRALRLKPDLLPLAVESVDLLVSLERYDEAAELISGLPGMVRTDGRIALAEAEVLLHRGDPAAAEALLDKGIELPNLREGANRLADLWRDVQSAVGKTRPVPAHYDFTMT